MYLHFDMCEFYYLECDLLNNNCNLWDVTRCFSCKNTNNGSSFGYRQAYIWQACISHITLCIWSISLLGRESYYSTLYAETQLVQWYFISVGLMPLIVVPRSVVEWKWVTCSRTYLYGCRSWLTYECVNSQWFSNNAVEARICWNLYCRQWDVVLIVTDQ